MEITLHQITIRDLIAGYIDDNENGVVAYGGRLDVRPPYQREFVYDDKKREAVIHSVRNGFPLNVMYWADCGDGHYEIIDGQQRTISICQYATGVFSYDFMFFGNLTENKKEEFLNYELMVYICKGTDSEKLEWFKIINIAGVVLSDQELRNAVYAGSWLSSAKKFFSKRSCVAEQIAKDYLSGSCIRQDYLETALRWISHGNIEVYMGKHQNDPNANELWMYFKAVIEWVKLTFPKYRKEMKGIEWGPLYDEYKGNIYDSTELEKQIQALMSDSDVKKKSGIYKYIFDGDDHNLDIRAFDDNTKRAVYEKQKGYCANPNCPYKGKKFELSEMEADHITPWKDGGHTVIENCQMLCRDCNRRKGSR